MPQFCTTTSTTTASRKHRPEHQWIAPAGHAVDTSQPVYAEAMPRSVAWSPSVRAQRGRLGGAGRAPRRRRLAADRRHASADTVLVNTCGFIEAAKKDSSTPCWMSHAIRPWSRSLPRGAVRRPLATALPEADAVLGFDSYADIAQTLRSIADGDVPAPHQPRDRRALLPITPVQRAQSTTLTPGHGDLPPGVAPASGPRTLRRRLHGGPTAPLKIASGCDRRCSFCAIPSFRGAYLSRQPDEIVAEAQWLVEHGVRELVLVSENSTSYGKDLGDVRLLERLLPQLAALVDRVRVSYLQPAEVRPTLLDVMTTTPGVVAYFDLSFQHASGPVLRRMRRFGEHDRFLDLLRQVRGRTRLRPARAPTHRRVSRETDADVAEQNGSWLGIGLMPWRSSLLRRGGHRSGDADGKLPERRSAPGSAMSPRWPGADGAASGESGRPRTFRYSSNRSTRAWLPKGALHTRPPRWMARPRCPALPLQPATSFTLA